MHDTSNISNNCLQTDYFTSISLYHNSSGLEVYIQKDECAFKQLGKFEKMPLEASVGLTDII